MMIFRNTFGGLAKIHSNGYPRPIFVFAGLLPWTFFAGVIDACSASSVSSEHLISRIYNLRTMLCVQIIEINLSFFDIE